VREKADMIRRSAQGMARLIEDLLEQTERLK
jgi:hypothetical protein